MLQRLEIGGIDENTLLLSGYNFGYMLNGAMIGGFVMYFDSYVLKYWACFMLFEALSLVFTDGTLHLFPPSAASKQTAVFPVW